MHIAIGTIAIILGLLGFGIGGFAFFAGMMSDNPEAGNEAGSAGVIGFIVGGVLIGFGIWMVL